MRSDAYDLERRGQQAAYDGKHTILHLLFAFAAGKPDVHIINGTVPVLVNFRIFDGDFSFKHPFQFAETPLTQLRNDVNRNPLNARHKFVPFAKPF